MSRDDAAESRYPVDVSDGTTRYVTNDELLELLRAAHAETAYPVRRASREENVGE